MTNAEHLNNLIKLHTRRLQDLERKAATFGLNVPSEITSEIEVINEEIAKLQASLTALTTVADLGQDTGVGSKPVDRRDEANQELRMHIMLATVQATVAEFLGLRKFVTERLDHVENAQEKQATHVSNALSNQTRYGVYVVSVIFIALTIIIVLILVRGS